MDTMDDLERVCSARYLALSVDLRKFPLASVAVEDGVACSESGSDSCR